MYMVIPNRFELSTSKTYKISLVLIVSLVKQTQITFIKYSAVSVYNCYDIKILTIFSTCEFQVMEFVGSKDFTCIFEDISPGDPLKYRYHLI